MSIPGYQFQRALSPIRSIPRDVRLITCVIFPTVTFLFRRHFDESFQSKKGTVIDTHCMYLWYKPRQNESF